MSDRWRTKLAAWTHDPAEKALVLLRDPAGHEGGTVRALRRELFGDEGEPRAEVTRRADRWASAADRPQFPHDKDHRFAAWSQVRFADAPTLIHPLSGDEFDLKSLHEIGPEAVKALSLDRFRKLVRRAPDGSVDARTTFLRFWRLGPVDTESEIGALWEWLPADTRVPDHTIWEHLRLTSALSTASESAAGPALLMVSLGPVQAFIAQARSTSDLWAGSHLLSQMAWEAMRLVCEEFGPDAILFPDLHGVAVVDRWLHDNQVVARQELPPDLFRPSDANPLFAASLPNKFVAVVPADLAHGLAGRIEAKLAEWVREQAVAALDLLLQEAGASGHSGASVARAQIDAQFAGFPEVAWSVVPWSLAGLGDQAEPEALIDALRVFTGGESDPGFFASPAWQVLSRPLDLDGAAFYRPNPGVLYPALYDLCDRALAAAKSARRFEALDQHGYRCSLCGEREWLTLDRDLLTYRTPDGEKLWSKVRPAWSKKGERLCAQCTLKRLWPNLFMSSVRQFTGEHANRYVVSTHTMALATTLGRIRDADREPQARTRVEKLIEERQVEPVALPRVLTRGPDHRVRLLRRIPGLLDESDERLVEEAEKAIADLAGTRRAESYYALAMLDGDKMGAWVGGEPDRPISYQDAWHPQVKNQVSMKPELADYCSCARSVSPARHVAISRALNGFSGTLAGVAVEEIYKGKLLYAGGDDVLAMVSVDDVIGLIATLRIVYSGLDIAGAREALAWPGELRSARGHVRWRNRLFRVMGSRATLSAGIVIAHHTAPLGAVLRDLRAAERAAKRDRDSLSIRLIKRSGGDTALTVRWGLGEADAGIRFEDSAPGLILALRDLFSAGVSRRAAYHAMEWLPSIPADADENLLTASLSLQLRRQGATRTSATAVARGLAKLWSSRTADERHEVLEAALTLGEFLSRNSRAVGGVEGSN